MASERSTAFSDLDLRIQRWIWKEGWDELRDIQEQAIPAILGGQRDVIIASATASGKTEAAFLPIASAVASAEAGLSVLAVSPLKALINDQHRRLEQLFEVVDLPVHRWHGDVADSLKKKVLQKPSGVLLITPESLEALFVRQAPKARQILSTVHYVVVDELHAFMGAERGRQLQSLLHRVELATKKVVPRIALSATLGDMDLACSFLRPGAPQRVQRIISTGGEQEVQLQIRGYLATPPRLNEKEAEAAEKRGEEVTTADLVTGDAVRISEDLFRLLRGGRHIVFANRRADVELYSDLLRRICEDKRVPVEFWPHHGSLDKSFREDAEEALKAKDRPATAIATSTLELGIDVGSVESIGQIGAPSSVASLRQRLGRSGRRGDPAVLRIFVQEEEITSTNPPHDNLRADLVQSVAAVRLLAARWFEPPVEGSLHLSTLVQQTLSLIAQHSGVRAEEAFTALCTQGAFRDVSAPMFADFLRDIGSHKLISQTHSGELVLGFAGEQLVNHYDFYAAFSTPEEYRLVSEGRTLGTLPIVVPLYEGLHIIFGGRRWQVTAVDSVHHVIELKRSAGGRAPSFGGLGALVHDRVRSEMLRVYQESAPVPFLDKTAAALLEEGRKNFRLYELERVRLVEWGKDSIAFPWRGDRAMRTLLIQLHSEGFDAAVEGIALVFRGAVADDAAVVLADIAGRAPEDARRIASFVENKVQEKHHRYLGDDLLIEDYARTHLDPVGANLAAKEIIEGYRISNT